jgi:hypothetical protein
VEKSERTEVERGGERWREMREGGRGFSDVGEVRERKGGREGSQETRNEDMPFLYSPTLLPA